MSGIRVLIHLAPAGVIHKDGKEVEMSVIERRLYRKHSGIPVIPRLM